MLVRLICHLIFLRNKQVNNNKKMIRNSTFERHKYKNIGSRSGKTNFRAENSCYAAHTFLWASTEPSVASLEPIWSILSTSSNALSSGSGVMGRVTFFGKLIPCAENRNIKVFVNHTYAVWLVSKARNRRTEILHLQWLTFMWDECNYRWWLICFQHKLQCFYLSWRWWFCSVLSQLGR